MLIAAVVPGYRTTELLRQAVLSLLEQDLPPEDYEVIVVDSSPNGENDAMLAELAAKAPGRLRWIRKEPEGPGPSRTRGATLTDAPIVAFLDSDCRATPGWLRAGLAAFEEDTGIVQGRTVAAPGQPLGIFRWYLRVERESPLYEAANIFYRRRALLEVGGFPRDLTPRSRKPMGGEDVAAAWKVKRKGWRSRFAPEALVHHEVVPLPPLNWVVIKQLFIFPLLLRDFPELRRFMYARIFLDRAQALFAAGVLGTVVAMAGWPAALLLWIPYFAVRASEPTASLRGPLRLVRALPYLARETVSFALLVAGSLRYRRLLL